MSGSGSQSVSRLAHCGASDVPLRTQLRREDARAPLLTAAVDLAVLAPSRCVRIVSRSALSTRTSRAIGAPCHIGEASAEVSLKPLRTRSAAAVACVSNLGSPEISMPNYTANPRSKSMVLEVDRLLRQLGVHEPTPVAPAPIPPPVRLVTPTRNQRVHPGAGSPRSGNAQRRVSPQGVEQLQPESAEQASTPSKRLSVPSGTSASQRAKRANRWASAALWARVAAGLALGMAMTEWPYRTGCGWALSAYLGAVVTIMLSGGWTAFASWKARNGPAHILSLMLIYWAFVLAAEQSLPRMGYAAEEASWSCVTSASR